MPKLLGVLFVTLVIVRNFVVELVVVDDDDDDDVLVAFFSSKYLYETRTYDTKTVHCTVLRSSTNLYSTNGGILAQDICTLMTTVIG
jgi:hypothetical protein